MWHAWRAAVLEDLGELPPQFEDVLVTLLREHVTQQCATLQAALEAGERTLASLQRMSQESVPVPALRPCCGPDEAASA